MSSAIRPKFGDFGYLVAFLLLSGAVYSVEPVSSNWPQFRGPDGTGHAISRGIPATWGSFLAPYAWQTPIPGRGWSSPIVIGNRVWLTSAESTALPESETTKKLADREGGIVDFKVHQSVSLFAIELDLDSGKLLRKLELFSIDQPPPIHATNSYASPTPTSDGERLYCHFGSLGTAGIDLASGTILWKHNFAVDDITGSGSSPILYRDRLIVVCDGSDEQFVIALDKRTGQVRWKTARPPMEASENFKRRAFSTPLVIEYQGRTQLIVPTAQWLVSYAPETGEEWWRCRTAIGYSVIPQPAFRDGLVYTCTGYMKPELWAIRADGSGDVSTTHVAWKHTRQAPEIASPIVIDDALYCVSNSGVLTCLQANDGQIRWQQRLEGRYTSSPLFVDGKLYITNQSGITTILAPGAHYLEITRNIVFGETMATLAVSGSSLLLRTDPVLYCIRNPP
jgi:outer membrane protein assembly factor BamB